MKDVHFELIVIHIDYNMCFYFVMIFVNGVGTL
jgi:hypothetical protein